jgi:hypothetical protein
MATDPTQATDESEHDSLETSYLKVFVAAGLLALGLAGLVPVFGWTLQARLPVLIGLIPLILCMTLVLGMEVKGLLDTHRRHRGADAPASAGDPDASGVADEPAAPANALMPLVWLAAFAAAVVGLGTLLGTAVFTLVFLMVRKEGVVLAIVYAVAAPVVLWAVFSLLLDVRTYSGWVGIW